MFPRITKSKKEKKCNFKYISFLLGKTLVVPTDKVVKKRAMGVHVRAFIHINPSRHQLEILQ